VWSSRTAIVAALAAGAALPAASAVAQAPPSAEALAAVAPAEAGVPLVRRRWIRPIASLIVPGSGQFLGGQPRGLVYLAAEAWFLARAVALREDSRRESAFFRTLAYTVARRRFGYTRVDGPWPYYEEMGKYIESGAYDADPGPALLPEADTATYNGHIWDLARRTYFVDPDSTPPPSSPEYAAALDFYRSRAVTDGFRWSWRDARLEQDVYRASIRASDDAYRAATNYLGAVLLNHLVSAVDAFIATRLGRRGVLPVVHPSGHGGALLEWQTAF
jgi:hypothetical protein